MHSATIPPSMDSLHLTEFVGLPSPLGWSHIVRLSNDDDSLILICFSVTGSQASFVGHELVALARSSQIPTEQALYDTIISLNAKTQDQNCHFSVAAGFLTARSGSWITLNGVIGLQRQGRFGRLLSSTDLAMRTGKLQENDTFVLATAAADGILDDIEELFSQGYQLAGIESSLERLIRTQPQQDQSAVALMEFVPAVSGESAPVAPPNPFADASQAVRPLIPPAAPLPPIHSLDDVAKIAVEHTGFSQERTAGSGIRDLLDEDRLPLPDLIPPEPVSFSDRLNAVKTSLREQVSPSAAVGRRWGKSIYGILINISHFLSRSVAAAKRGMQQLPWQSWRSTKKFRIITITVIIIILATSALLLTLRWQQQRTETVAARILLPHKQTLASIEHLSVTDPVAAQEELAQLATAISEQLQTNPSKIETTALKEYMGEVQAYGAELKGEIEVRSLPILMDLQSVESGFVTSLADGIPGFGLYVDQAKKKAIFVSFTEQQTRVFDLSTLDPITAVTLRSSAEAIFLAKGLYSLDLTKESVPVAVKPEGDSNREATRIDAYDTYVYVFNPNVRNIFRYIDGKNGYSDPIGWLLSPLSVPADSISSLVVDGDVWLATKNGQINKYSSGRVTGFQVSNLEEPLTGAVQLYTSEDDQYLYAFVPAQSRVVVFTKDGIFVKQIKSEVLSGALFTIADEANGKLYAISGSTIYEASL